MTQLPHEPNYVAYLRHKRKRYMFRKLYFCDQNTSTEIACMILKLYDSQNQTNFNYEAPFDYDGHAFYAVQFKSINCAKF